MTTAEKLTKVAENIPKVYEAGFEAGKAEGGGDGVVELADVTLTDLQKQGRLTLDGSFSILSTISTNILDGSGTAVISVTGNVEFTLKLDGCALAIIKVDGKDIYSWDQSDQGASTSETVEYSGKVNESIAIEGGLFTGTFERLAVENNYDKGYADGKQAEYDRFWDEYQNKGSKIDYLYGFAGKGWTDNTYNPKYSITPSANCQNMYSYSTITDTKVPIDISGAVRNVSNMFSNTKLVTIRELIVSETTASEASKGLANVFTGSNKLENITIVGVIAKSIDVQWCTKLTANSLLSILTALSKDSSVASGKSITFATASQAVIEADAQCLEQYNLALAAGWEIIFA